MTEERPLPDIDLKLLRTLHLLLTESSVSRVAQILGQSQPAVSAALKRLRDMIGDPLLVRSGGHLVRTERADRLVDLVERILQDVGRLVDDGAGFDPAIADGLLHIATATALGPLLLPRIVALARAEAPRLRLEVSCIPSDEALPKLMDAGEIDLMIGTWPDREWNLRYAPLVTSETVCVMRPEHPLARAKGLTMARYLALDHVSPTVNVGLQWSPVDGPLAALGLRRRVAVALPEYGLVPGVLACTDLVFTTCRLLADHLAASMPFAVIDAPPEFGPMRFFLLWHERVHQSPANRWLRGIVRRAAAEVAALEPPTGDIRRSDISRR